MWSGGARHLGGIAVVAASRPIVPAPRVGTVVKLAPFGRPSWRGRLHAWAFLIAVPAGALLIAAADRPTARLAAAIYATTLVLVFGTSAAYHRLTRTERARSIMQRLDHSMIYLLIAGTYLPLCLVVLPPSWGIPLLAVVAVMTVLGMVLKLAAFHRMQHLSYALYPVMGCVVVAALPVLVRHLSALELTLLIGGGVAYLGGTPVLLTRRPDPWPAHFGYHEVWHLCTVVAAALHFGAVTAVVA